MYNCRSEHEYGTIGGLGDLGMYGNNAFGELFGQGSDLTPYEFEAIRRALEEDERGKSQCAGVHTLYPFVVGNDKTSAKWHLLTSC